MQENSIKCPKCGSSQITAQKKGFSIGQAIVGGVVGGFIGSQNVNITCLNCGKVFRPGDSQRAQAKVEAQRKWDAMTKEQKETKKKDDASTLVMMLFLGGTILALFFNWKIAIVVFAICCIGLAIYKKSTSSHKNIKDFISALLFTCGIPIGLFLFWKGITFGYSWLMHISG